MVCRSHGCATKVRKGKVRQEHYPSGSPPQALGPVEVVRPKKELLVQEADHLESFPPCHEARAGAGYNVHGATVCLWKRRPVKRSEANCPSHGQQPIDLELLREEGQRGEPPAQAHLQGSVRIAKDRAHRGDVWMAVEEANDFAEEIAAEGGIIVEDRDVTSASSFQGDVVVLRVSPNPADSVKSQGGMFSPNLV